MSKEQVLLGIDVGGTGIKAALINTKKGTLETEKYRVLTPKPSTPEAVAKVISRMIKRFDYRGPVGVGFPAIIHHGEAKSAANIDKKWINTNIEKLLKEVTGNPFYVANDADVAGLAELRFGKAKGEMGTVIVLTIGTGIGSAMFLNGALVPNTEFGHLLFKESVYEHYVSNSARKKNDLSWDDWGKRFNKYLIHLEKLFSPDMFVLGGGASKKFDRFEHVLTVNTKVVPAAYQNDAGVLGAGLYAESRLT